MSLPPANWDCFIDDSCVLCLLFEEGEGDTAHDLTRFRNDGTLYGPTWVSTPYGRGLEFDGVDDYVKVPASSSLDITDDITIEALIKVTGDISKRQGIVTTEGDRPRWALEIRYSRLRFFAYPEDGSDYELYGNTSLTSGVWYHVVGVYSVTCGYTRVYLNGALDGEESRSVPLGRSLTDINIGRYQYANAYLNGIIALVRIYNRALTADEIRALCQNFRYGLACYKLIGQVINPLISDTYERVELIRKIQTNRWKIENNQLIIYDDDGVTPLKVFNLRDKYGNPSEVNVYEREPAE